MGKTFAMLDEGHRRRDRGTDVVVGLVETHGREHTRAELEGLEVLPRARVSHRGATLEELDLDRHADGLDAAVVAYPHHAAAPVVAGLRERGVRVVDLSADFRLRDQAVYEDWYGEHGAPALGHCADEPERGEKVVDRDVAHHDEGSEDVSDDRQADANVDSGFGRSSSR